MSDTLLTFPCEFPIKVMGKATKDFGEKVRQLLTDKQVELLNYKERLSKEGKFMAVTVVVKAQSQQQLDDIYRLLSAQDWVTMTL